LTPFTRQSKIYKVKKGTKMSGERPSVTPYEDESTLVIPEHVIGRARELGKEQPGDYRERGKNPGESLLDDPEEDELQN
jgi:hypothetical protein